MRTWTLCAAVVLAAVSAGAQDGPAVYTQRCATCHESGAPGNRAPRRDVLAAFTIERIVSALESGLMRQQGESMTPAERRAVAAYLSTAAAPSPITAAPPCPSSTAPTESTGRDWNGWGVALNNDRFAPAPGFTPAQVPQLTLKWAFGFEGEAAAATQPTIVGDWVFVGSGSGNVYALGLQNGCTHWRFKADAGVRAAPRVVPGPSGLSLILADLHATVYSVDVASGQLQWKVRVEDHRSARISGSPVVYSGGPSGLPARIYFGVSSGEEGTGAQAKYECCTFRGSVVALDAATGTVVWKTYLIPDPPKPIGRNKAGTQLWGPAGAAVWSSPTIDTKAQMVYVATGDAYTRPAAPTTDSVVALDLKSGTIAWTRQLLADDAWNMACGSNDPANCPDNEGPDADFGQPPILVTLRSGARVLTLGQKSAIVYGLDPDDKGRVLWTRKIGRGGMIGGAEWGSASDGTNIYVPLSDLTFRNRAALGRGGLDPTVGGGVFAIRVIDGELVWSAKPPPCGPDNCSPAQGAPPALTPGALFEGSLDGHLRAYSTRTGQVLWDVDTAREFTTVNGVKATGGSIDVGGPAIANGFVLTTSGNPTWGGKRGNVLLAYGLP
jgi:polyvinyl alcohol dehydrogenase (cytochrome)